MLTDTIGSKLHPTAREQWKDLQKLATEFLNKLKTTGQTKPTEKKLTELADLFAVSSPLF